MNSGGSPFYYQYDIPGSVVNVTSSTGATEWSYSYEPFGVERSSDQNDPSAPVNPMRFVGELHDAAIGMYDLRARSYDPTTGQFLQVDPMSEPTQSPSVSAYIYGANAPSLFADPSGRSPISNVFPPLKNLYDQIHEGVTVEVCGGLTGGLVIVGLVEKCGGVTVSGSGTEYCSTHSTGTSVPGAGGALLGGISITIGTPRCEDNNGKGYGATADVSALLDGGSASAYTSTGTCGQPTTTVAIDYAPGLDLTLGISVIKTVVDAVGGGSNDQLCHQQLGRPPK